ncbi:MAG: manganese efflux pump MntP family protein [Bacteroidales bacterium]
MDIVFILLLALALSFDSFAVSVSCGFYLPSITFWRALQIGLSLAFFQALMPLLGWSLGESVKPLVQDYDHWVAFGLLSFLGLKMGLESFSGNTVKSFNPLDPLTLLGLSLATSIDAFIAGLSIAMADMSIYAAAVIIGGITLLAAMMGILIGKKTGITFGKRTELIGGIVLFLIGLKILLQHTL